jgi:hypothetical protein|tara:strand:- start:160 stop:462 length:303 start_codon:yes stop_codon:yes gene_type:complete
MAKSYADQPKLNFSIFENRFKTGSKHPDMTGIIEFTRPFLKSMVEEAKSGTMPTLKVAMWERTGRDSGKPYQYMRIELDQRRGSSEQEEDAETEDDGLPF